MNTAPSTTTRTAFTAALLASATPYLVGVITAEKGEAFAPEQFFIRDGDMMEFCEGFELVRGECAITRDFKRSIVEAVDLEDHMEEIAWIRGGC